jgi:purine-binding chemotaxis protein CheW
MMQLSIRNEELSAGEYVTAVIGGELIGLPILRVQDVFVPDHITPVPLAPHEIAGVINLRGRIVTLIDLRSRFGMPPADSAPLAIGIESEGESFGLLIDGIGEVLRLSEAEREPNPINLDQRLAYVSLGIHRLEDRLLMVVDVDRVLQIETAAAAA